ncbi:uncharacterized protein L969DRAFT_18792 [Mixia osmundae IAM 14324]|uniref:Uncharacterized protein n=1 Tax=Mixia osmundae (strain CBS 9802 / IAM 14324 / JCM 22182 / KY 12970) TaxID=764103 RepID=G7DSE5_MIXOS|nr:uncharacterized protein L969DRAFT_18792 [Mixia osmundae IAM 14324]KEI38001.1 hypothetical protein L969DRAFT_18792 [Mixia osmundae IAM 14324]GAA93505.1 hypothetical protein E5Q_00146 [Mixia osmundae IAM 14324]
MFSAFEAGKDRIVSQDVQSPSNYYVAGRYRAHALPASPLTSQSRRRLGSVSRRLSHVAPEDVPEDDERTWLLVGLRPGPQQVHRWLNAWWRRWAILVLVPCLIIWIWCALPFPVSDPYGTSKVNDQQAAQDEDDLPVDVNFYFFLLIYFGLYQAGALVWITSLFGLYRLNWWPQRLGGKISYAFMWMSALAVGLLLHHLDAFGIRRRQDEQRPKKGHHNPTEDPDWGRKTLWVSLAFLTMSMPALACFIKLRSDRRMSYRHSLTDMQRTFLERQLTRRIPKSYIRFLWFCLSLIVALVSLILGQGYATVFLNTLPHQSLDGAAYVWTWIITVQILSSAVGYILEYQVRSRALLFVFRYYFLLVYYVFYRTLFARLRSPDQYALIQLLSSIWIITFYPIALSKPAYRSLQWLVGYERSYEEHQEIMGHSLYLRNLAENVTALGFLGWLTILHFGPNSDVYPFFKFDSSDNDPFHYTYSLTAIATLLIWATELASSFAARQICRWIYAVDITNMGLNCLREFPELTICLVWTSVHVMSDILLFLVKLNFR